VPPIPQRFSAGTIDGRKLMGTGEQRFIWKVVIETETEVMM